LSSLRSSSITISPSRRESIFALAERQHLLLDAA